MAEWLEGKRMLAWADKIDLREVSTRLLAEQIRSVVDEKDPGFQYVIDILEFIRGNRDVFPEQLLASADAIFFRNIIDTTRGIQDRKAVIHCGTEYDSTIRRQATPPTVGELCNIVAMSKIIPSKEISILASVRDDGPYLIEWIAHHKAIGVDHFFLYSNDNNDGSDDVLRALAKNGTITFIHNELGPTVHPSIKSYTHALHFVHEFRDYKWTFVLDSDELVWPTTSIENFIERLEADEEHSPCLLLNWKLFGSNVYGFIDEPLSKRFKHWKRDLHVKSFFRPRDAIRIFSHHPLLKKPFSVRDASFATRNLVEELNRFCSYQNGEIRHYWQKSFEEFSIKVARGVGRPGYERGFNDFFSWNVRHIETTKITEHDDFEKLVAFETQKLLAVPEIKESRARSLRISIERMKKNAIEFDLEKKFELGMVAHPWINE